MYVDVLFDAHEPMRVWGERQGEPLEIDLSTNILLSFLQNTNARTFRVYLILTTMGGVKAAR